MSLKFYAYQVITQVISYFLRKYLNTEVIDYFFQTVIVIVFEYFYQHVTVIVFKYIIVAFCNSLRNPMYKRNENFEENYNRPSVNRSLH